MRLTVASQDRLKPELQRWSPALRRKEVRQTVASQDRLKPELQQRESRLQIAGGRFAVPRGLRGLRRQPPCRYRVRGLSLLAGREIMLFTRLQLRCVNLLCSAFSVAVHADELALVRGFFREAENRESVCSDHFWVRSSGRRTGWGLPYR